jgi:hypothetical protein
MHVVEILWKEIFEKDHFQDREENVRLRTRCVLKKEGRGGQIVDRSRFLFSIKIYFPPQCHQLRFV